MGLITPGGEGAAACRRGAGEPRRCHAPPRAGRVRRVARRRRGAAASTGCRSSTSSTRTSRCTGYRGATAVHASSSTARSTTTSSCARSSPREHGARFVTDGDTETIVAAYHYLGPDRGPPPARHVRVPDLGHPSACVFGARDPFGIKPLFYVGGRRTAWRSPARRRACSSWRRRLGEPTTALDRDRAAALPAAAVRAGAARRCTAAIRRVESGTSLHRLPRRADVDRAVLRPAPSTAR